MIGWIVLGVVVFAIVLLIVVAFGTLGRLRGLERASRRVETGQRAKAEALRRAVVPMRESIEQLTSRLEVTQERLAGLKSRPSGGD